MDLAAQVGAGAGQREKVVGGTGLGAARDRDYLARRRFEAERLAGLHSMGIVDKNPGELAAFARVEESPGHDGQRAVAGDETARHGDAGSSRKETPPIRGLSSVGSA